MAYTLNLAIEGLLSINGVPDNLRIARSDKPFSLEVVEPLADSRYSYDWAMNADAVLNSNAPKGSQKATFKPENIGHSTIYLLAIRTDGVVEQPAFARIFQVEVFAMDEAVSANLVNRGTEPLGSEA